ncbi:MAG TPA: hypothetical protein VM557_10515 [Thermoanaerobaculia bacterium]|nr:hypothetical protein [Thermoanaerobaculia bacterium]
MPKLTAEIGEDLSSRIDAIVRDGWFPSREALVREALQQFAEAKSFLGDSPRMIQRFAADALNESKPETALRFADRALSLLVSQEHPDLQLYQSLVELRVQILLVMNRAAEAMETLQEAREKLPNNPAIARWIEKVKI